MKKSFVLYHDQYEAVKDLPADQKSQLFDAIFLYCRGEELPEFDPIVKIVFKFFQIAFDRDSTKYLKRCEKNRENVRKRWDTKDTTVCGGIQPDTKHTDSGNGSVSDIDSGNDIKDIPPTPLPVAPNINPEIIIFVKQFQEWALSEFGLSAEKITDSLITNGSDAVDKLIRIDGFSQEDVFDSIRWASNNHFWNDKIKSLSGIRKRASNEQMKFKNMFSDYEKRNSSGGSVRTDQNIKTAKSWADRKKKEMEANGQ